MVDLNEVGPLARAIVKIKSGASNTEYKLALEVVRCHTELARIDKAASSFDRMACEAKTVADICKWLEAKLEKETQGHGMKLMRNEGIVEILPKLRNGDWKRGPG